MPDWLTVLSATKLHTDKSGKPDPVSDAIRGMSTESGNAPAIISFIDLKYFKVTEYESVFRRLVLAYKTAVDQHQTTVSDCLDSYTRRGSGRALLKELGRSNHTIHVLPHWHYFMALGDEGYHNASATGVRPRQNLAHITDGLDDDLNDTRVKGLRFGHHLQNRGTGKGADVVVYFSAGAFTDTFLKDYMTGEAGTDPDEVLYHELVHATRMIHGTMTFRKVRGRPHFGNVEEYFAVAITNIYLSEKGVRLRGAYDPGSEENPPKDWSVMKHPADFYGNIDKLSLPPAKLMDEFKRTQRPFYDDLARLPTPPWFNPVKIHFRLTERVPV
jgi:hypothetical protein